MTKLVPFLLFVTGFNTIIDNTDGERMNLSQSDRLPNRIVPLNYRLKITIHDEIFTNSYFEPDGFSGIVSITFQTRESTDQIQINEKNMKIQNMELKSNNENIPLINDKTNYNNKIEILTIYSQEFLTSDKIYILTISYYGMISEMHGGILRTIRFNLNPNKRIVYTHAQPTYARRIFPCFDEPAFKATFDLTLEYPSEYTALSNTEIFSTVNQSNKTITTFKTTPIMSPYLLAFAILQNTFSETEELEGNIDVKVWTPEDKADYRKFSLKYVSKLTKALEDYTGIQYKEFGLGKMDHVSITNFPYVGMENWGLIFYSQSDFLVGSWTPEHEKPYFIRILAHELAHQWFGNLVTCHWWSDAFLNEGFADFFAFYIANKELPNWRLNDFFIMNYIFDILSFNKIKALSSPVTAQNALSNFQESLYKKGASIIRMVQSFIGENNFRRAIQFYLKRNQFNSTQPEDLWDAFNNFTTYLPHGISVNEIMANWTYKERIPLVRVTYNGNQIKLTQEVCPINNDTKNTRWYIPITYYTKENLGEVEDTIPKEWLTPDGDVYIRRSLGKNEWFILNNKMTGIYITKYDDELQKRIFNALRQPDFGGINEISRGQLVTNMISLEEIGLITTTELLDFLKFLKNDISILTWYPAIKAFKEIWITFLGKDLFLKLREYLIDLANNIYNHIQFFKINNPLDSLKKYIITNFVCVFLKSKQCINTDRNLDELIGDDSSTKTIKYCLAFRYGEESSWTELLSSYENSDDEFQKALILKALNCNENSVFINRLLKSTFCQNSTIEPKDKIKSMLYIAKGTLKHLLLQFIFNSFDEIYETATINYTFKDLHEVLKEIGNNIYNQVDISLFKKIIQAADEKNSSLSYTAKTALKNLKQKKIKIYKRKKSLDEFFKSEIITESTVKMKAATEPSEFPKHNSKRKGRNGSSSLIRKQFTIFEAITLLIFNFYMKLLTNTIFI